MDPGESRGGSDPTDGREDLEARHRDMVRDARRDIIEFLGVSASLADVATADDPGRALEVLSLALDIAQYAEDEREVDLGVGLARQMRAIASSIDDAERLIEAVDWEIRLLERSGHLSDTQRIELLGATVHPLVRLGRNSDANHRLARALDAATMSVATGAVRTVVRDAVLNVVAHPLGALGSSHLRSRLAALGAQSETAGAWAGVLDDSIRYASGDTGAVRSLIDGPRDPSAVTADPALAGLVALVRTEAANSVDSFAEAVVIAESASGDERHDPRVDAALCLATAAAARGVGRHQDAERWIAAAIASDRLEPLALVRAHEVAAGIAIDLRRDRDAASHLIAARRLTPLALAGTGAAETASTGMAEIDLRHPAGTAESADDFGLRRRVVALERAIDERTEQLQAVLGRRGGRDIEQLICDAMARDWFELWFQPIRVNSTGRIGGAEALLRLRHPERGVLHPGAFLGAGIPDGTQRALNEWVVDRACSELSRWGEMGVSVGVSVNIAGNWVDPDLAGTVEHAITTHGVDPALVTLEITEESPLPLGPATAGAISDLRAAGVRIALDDFGTGFSSLDHLLRLDVDTVKIDQRFATRLDTDPRSRAIVAAVVAMSADLGFQVVIEGIETSAALDEQRRLGVHSAQGFFIGPPRPASGFGGLLWSGPIVDHLIAASGG